ncbi:hypothetical protein LIER_03319 [Lithospermum erythrorhizon]|uniref:Uncharacterized protein n=1 Tax=Lithospermum erythrorhizon TaxID=34254 RepID=A0AAV3NXD8_LITER
MLITTVGVSLSASNSTSFTIDAPLERVLALKLWFDSVREMELPGLLDDYSIAFAKDLVDRNLVRRYSIGDILAAEQGLLDTFVPAADPLGTTLDVIARIRPLVSMDVFDHSGNITAGAIESVAEQILRCDVSELRRSITKGTGYDLDPLKTNFDDKMYPLLLRCTYNRRSVTQKHLLLVAYFDDTVFSESEDATQHSNPDLPPATIANTSEGTLKVSPLKRLMDNISIQTDSPVKKALFQDATKEFSNTTSGIPATQDELASSATQLCTID